VSTSDTAMPLWAGRWPSRLVVLCCRSEFAQPSEVRHGPPGNVSELYDAAIPTPGGLAVEHHDLERLLIEHNDAWNSHDLSRLMSLFAEDCVFEASAGPEACGQSFDGWTHVRASFADVFDSMPDANWGASRHFVISDDYGVSEWRLTGTLADGSRVDVFGCDFITVRDDKIVRKNSFRKQRPLLAP
jgi:ketosteroid isomerase-like protein